MVRSNRVCVQHCVVRLASYALTCELLLLLAMPVSEAIPTPAARWTFDCPLPSGVESASQKLCSQHLACLWLDDPANTSVSQTAAISANTASKCQLRQQVGYRLKQSMAGYDGRQRVALLQRKQPTLTMFGDDIDTLRAEIVRYSCHTARVTLRDANRRRYEVPLQLEKPRACSPNHHQHESYTASFATPPTDGVLVTLTYANSSIHVADTLIYSDQFIETHMIFDSDDVYGFGENNHDTFRHNTSTGTTWAMFARDQPPGDTPQNLYGVHPFFIGIINNSGSSNGTTSGSGSGSDSSSSGHSFGVFFLNSNAMEYRFERLGSQTALTFRTIGGVLDMFFLFGASPLHVVRRYSRLVGRPLMPAYWALGFQLSRFGYRSTDDIRAIYRRNRAAGVPQDIQYADIDYMDGRRDFTVDQQRFANLSGLVRQLRAGGVQFVLIYDPAIAADFGTYPTVARAVGRDVFVKWMNRSLVPASQCEGCGDYIVGRVWPDNRTLFPDFFKHNTTEWWTKEMYIFHRKMGGPQGIWIDMNEPSNFDTNIATQAANLLCPTNKYDDPPYPTMLVREPSNVSKRLSDKTICMVAKHTADMKSRGENNGKKRSNTYLHYDVHNLYGWSEFRATRAAMDRVMPESRGVLVGRSTFPGAGRWGGHWTGDNTSRWKDLRRSIVGLLEFNMFGIPYVGADICGFNGNTTERLCLRWTQLGAFYPFCRNHNTDNGRSQDPAVWPSVARAARQALGLRYRLLPLLYTLLYHAQRSGSMVVRPLAFQFPGEKALRHVDTQFMWGDSVMVVAVVSEPITNSDSSTASEHSQHSPANRSNVSQSATTTQTTTSVTSHFSEVADQVNVVFPSGGWFHMHDGAVAVDYIDKGVAQSYYTVALDQMIPVFVRNGSILVLQANATNTYTSRRNPFQVHVFGGPEARGDLYWDDGNSRRTLQRGEYHRSLFRYTGNTLRMRVARNGTRYMHDPHVRLVVFYGVVRRPRAVMLDNSPLSDASVHYNDRIQSVTLEPLQVPMATDHEITLL